MLLKILLLDDHPSVTSSYKNGIDGLNLSFPYKTAFCHTLEECYSRIFIEKKIPDFIIIDLSMPAYLKEKINDGFDLAQLIRDNFSKTKIIISTMHTSPLYIYSIIEKIKPEGFFIKSDLDFDEISKALQIVISGDFYYTKIVKDILTNMKKHFFCEDELNRNIMILTSKRYTNKEIGQFLKISESTIEKRKSVLKQHLGIDGSNDRKMTEVLTNLSLL